MRIRVLVIFPFPLLPATHGGRVRALGLAGGLAGGGAEIDVLCPWHPRQGRGPALPTGVRLHPHTLAANALPLLVAERIASPQALLSLQPRSASLRRRLRRFDDVDIVQIHFCPAARWLGLLPATARVVYVAHNVERDYVAMQPRLRLVRAFSERRLGELEATLVSRSDLVVACTEHDAARLTELYGAPSQLVVLGQGHDRRALVRDPALRSSARQRLGIPHAARVVVFVGGPSEHNRDALRFLADDVVARLGAGALLVAVGGCARTVARSPSVLALGYVDDLSDVYSAADVAVNPVAFGSGASLKVVEALAAGLPVVATPVGARGVPPTPGLVVAARARFAEIVAATLASTIAAEPPPGRSWAELGARLLRRYETLIGSTRSVTAR